MRRAWLVLVLALQACAAPDPVTRECAIDEGRPPGLVARLSRGEQAVRDLRAEDARREFEYVLEVLAWMPSGVDVADLRRRAGDGLVHVRGILQER
jgi:hypothetical protein